MGFLDVLDSLREITSQDLKVCVAHEFLRAVNVHAVVEALQGKSASEVVQAWSRDVCFDPTSADAFAGPDRLGRRINNKRRTAG